MAEAGETEGYEEESATGCLCWGRRPGFQNQLGLGGPWEGQQFSEGETRSTYRIGYLFFSRPCLDNESSVLLGCASRLFCSKTIKCAARLA